jgi:hypothetical protein
MLERMFGREKKNEKKKKMATTRSIWPQHY